MYGIKLEDRVRVRRGTKANLSAGMMTAKTRGGKVRACHLNLESACIESSVKALGTPRGVCFRAAPLVETDCSTRLQKSGP